MDDCVTPTSPIGPLPRSTDAWTIAAAGQTDRGRVKRINEDRYRICPDLGFFAVADGVGGRPAGEVASRLVLDSVCGFLEKEDLRGIAATCDAGTCGARCLVAGFERANRDLRGLAEGNTALLGMGTTFVGALLVGQHIVVAHAGDSRAYELRGDHLIQLTEDHNLGREFLRRGLLKQVELATFPYRNTITRFVGQKDDLCVETRTEPVQMGSVYLLSSDGLHGVVPHGEIAEILRAEPDPQCAATALIERANAAGGPDNITAVVLHVMSRTDPSGLNPLETTQAQAHTLRNRSVRQRCPSSAGRAVGTRGAQGQA